MGPLTPKHVLSGVGHAALLRNGGCWSAWGQLRRQSHGAEVPVGVSGSSCSDYYGRDIRVGACAARIRRLGDGRMVLGSTSSGALSGSLRNASRCLPPSNVSAMRCQTTSEGAASVWRCS
jgi:hypothetical protein